MKFAAFKYWRQKGDCCLFIEILEIIEDTESMTTLRVSWNRQLHDMWRVLGTENIRVRQKEFQNWVTYNPRGGKIEYAS